MLAFIWFNLIIFSICFILFAIFTSFYFQGGSPMFQLFTDLTKKSPAIDQKINEIQNQLKCLPEGKLAIAHNGKNTKWYQSDGQNRKYIPKSNRTLAEQLALRKYLSLVLEELLQEKTAISFYDRHSSIESKSALLLQDSSLGYSELLSPYFQVPPSHTAWLQENYDRSSRNPENLIYKTVNGILVRSKSEALIAMLLYTNKIPFRYECALTLGDIKFYPDFTILHPKTDRIFYWEHFGLMDSPGYRQNIFFKQQVYATHGILPTIQLLTTYESQMHPLNTELVEKMIQYYFLQ